MKQKILYLFGGEKAQGAEIVIERLITYNSANMQAHLMLSPGAFADSLLTAGKPYTIVCTQYLKKLNRSKTSRLSFYTKALIRYFTLSYIVYIYIKKNRIDIIHANTIVASSYLLPLIIFSKIFMPKKTWLWSDHDMKYFSKLENVLSNWCVRAYTSTVVVSNAVKKKYSESEKVVVLYNGLDTRQFRPDLNARTAYRLKFNFGDKAVVFGIAANICPGKGQLGLIEAFNAAALNNPNMRLLIAGWYAPDDTHYNDSVREAIALNPKITHLGFVDNMIDFYNGCDVILNNSNLYRSESLGTTIYEAMACCKIVIASSTGGTPEIISDRIDGYMFEPENVKQFSAVMSKVAASHRDSLSVAKAARQKVISKFSIERMASKYNQIVASVAARRLQHTEAVSANNLLTDN